MSETISLILSGAAETLLITLHIRAMESQRPDALLKDERAEALVRKISADRLYLKENTMQAKPDLTVPLPNTSAGLSQVGGKGASLARMAAAGLPVPPGFHVTTAAYRQFVAEHNLQEQILTAVYAATPDQPATLEEASSRIGQLFAQRAMPEDIAEAIRRAYAELGEGDVPVAVRSSAIAEDLPSASFAGQQETYLNIRGTEAVLEAVKKCWA